MECTQGGVKQEENADLLPWVVIFLILHQQQVKRLINCKVEFIVLVLHDNTVNKPLNTQMQLIQEEVLQQLHYGGSRIMANLDHDAIRKVYPDVVTIDDTGAFYKDGKSVTLDQTKIDAARTTIDAEICDSLSIQRKAEYPSIEDQLDDIYHNGVAATWKTTIKAIKDKYPKPS